MAYPSIEQYQIALQHPETAFTDNELAAGKIRTSNIGWPLVASGGFALTYAVETPSKKHAVRCFHREASGIERRYAAISAKLAGLSSSHFVQFEFQRDGVKINSVAYPLVKMAWAQGETLGEFVESNYRDRGALTNLILALADLSAFLEAQGIAHGDIQEGNLMVADGGRKVQLIDYDGMFVPEIAALGGTELGHRDFQHPKRTFSNFGARLDRFSFIVLNLSLRALCAKPSLWNTSQSGAGVIVCRANDFASPSQSTVLQEIAQIPGLERDTKNFMAICASEFSSIPTLADFVAGDNVPRHEALTATDLLNAQRGGYLSQYPVLDAADYALFHEYIGSMVELVGKIVEVKELKKNGRTFFFINFGHWRENAVQIAVWTNALRGARQLPSKGWEGQWVTIRGLVQPVYEDEKWRFKRIAIEPKAVSQIIVLTDQEARYRLTTASAPPPRAAAPIARNNSNALQTLMASSSMGASIVGHTPQQPSSAAKPVASQPTLSANQLALQRMRQQAPTLPAQSSQRSQVSLPTARVNSNLTIRPAPQSANSSLQAHHQALKHQGKRGFFGWLRRIFG